MRRLRGRFHASASIAGAVLAALVLLPTPFGAADGPPKAPPDPLLIGEFDLADDAVVDGDTIRLRAPNPSVRVLGVDCEEVFHKKSDREASETDFAAYAKAKRGDSKMPVKFGTPEGEEAKRYAQALFAGEKRVRLERDEQGRDHDGYGRLLAHVFLLHRAHDGSDVLYAEDAIRRGHSPYFTKYGRSEQFDARFRAAQEEAKTEKRGIWADAPPHYPDYPERLAWWEQRAKQVDAWNAEFRGKPGMEDHVRLGVEKETNGLRDLLGKRVTLFGSLDGIDDFGATKRLRYVDRPREPFPVVVFDDATWKALDLDAIRGRYARVSGTLSEHQGRLQVVLASPADLATR